MVRQFENCSSQKGSEDSPYTSEPDFSPSKQRPSAVHNSEPDFSPLPMHSNAFDDHFYSASALDDTGNEPEMDMSATLKINLTYSLGMWSIGSAKHATGDCKPCGFLWKKGCHKAQNCHFCHLCKSDEVKKRKRDKIAARRLEEQMMWECGDDEHQCLTKRPEFCQVYQSK